jgi:hypothetical protein
MYHELLFVQIASSQCMLFLLHIQKMMMNVAVTLQPMAEYLTSLHIVFFSTPLLIFFLTILFPPPDFVCAHPLCFFFLYYSLLIFAISALMLL